MSEQPDIQTLAQWLTAKAPELFGTWRDGTLVRFLAFHLKHGTLFVHADGSEILGAAVAWRAWRGEILDAVRHKAEVFFWRPDDPEGNVLWLGEFVSTRRGTLQALTAQITERFPNWAGLEVMTLRGKKLVRYRAARLERALNYEPLAA